jgi:hypothetical protein
VNPGSGFEGRVWGEGHVEAFAQGRGDAFDVREMLAPGMPKAGEDRSAVSDVFSNVYAYCIELMARPSSGGDAFGWRAVAARRRSPACARAGYVDLL